MFTSQLCCAANERTFLHWMNMSVTIGSISAALVGKPACLLMQVLLKSAYPGDSTRPVCLLALLRQTGRLLDNAEIEFAFHVLISTGISGHAHKNWGDTYVTGSIFVRGIALAMMGIAILMTLYAAHNFRLRGEMLT